MLEHAIDPDEAGSGPAPSTAPAEDSYYIPKHAAEALTGSGKPPRVKRFNRKMLALIGAIAGVVIVLAFAVGLQQPKVKPPEAVATTARSPVPNAAVNSLPGGYDAVVPQLGDPRPGDLGTVNGTAGADGGANPTAPPRQLSPIEQYVQQAELDRLRNEDRARSATVSFANAGGNDASVGSQSSAAALDATQLQQRLLELAQRGGGGAPGAVPGSSNLSSRDDANRQDDKTEFA